MEEEYFGVLNSNICEAETGVECWVGWRGGGWRVGEGSAWGRWERDGKRGKGKEGEQ